MIGITEKEFERLAAYVKQSFGLHLGKEKKMLVLGRLGRVLQTLNMKSFTDYLDYVTADRTGQAAVTLINRLTTNHTFFMREADHFDYFRDRVLPEIMPRLKDKDLRVWSAGCSTGEEPYTLAMLIDEYLDSARTGWDTTLLATDISEHVIRQAVRGVYPAESVELLPKRWRLSYFVPHGTDQYAVTGRIRKEVVFRRFNLMDPFPFRRRFHVIFCRNVMIYFDEHTRRQLIRKFYDSLVPGGYLFIGHSETINRFESPFKYVKPSVYRKE
ncbi:MAG: chemotaxis protein CheR [Thermobacillus sp.]|uniref:CheR family methyltransferase n=1 Tax=Thermobacillus sp. TaxID=2108467 RepID=UPI000E3782BC|nr:protein-glutamate O-methyltransferase CheR [Thermobacillus sp.]REK56580.1 MAG: chemotaxis protein CheR [Thermobacillus sp.]